MKMRKQTVEVGNIKYEVRERKIKDLQPLITDGGLSLFGDIKEFMAADDKEVGVSTLFDAAFSSFCERGPEFFPGLKKENFEEMYPSELEGLVDAFLAVNFTGLRRLMEKVLPMITAVGDFRDRSTAQESQSDSPD